MHAQRDFFRPFSKLRADQGRWRVVALVITFGLGSLNAAACPILCSAEHCMEHTGTSTLPVMPAGSHACCPGHSGGGSGAHCGAAASGCPHAQYTAFSNSAAIGAPQVSSLSILTLHWVPRLNPAFSTATYSSPSPPGFLTGKAICQKESLFRI